MENPPERVRAAARRGARALDGTERRAYPTGRASMTTKACAQG